MTRANVSPAAFGVAANPPIRSRYGQAVIGMFNDIQDCWPCDDLATSTSLRNLVPGGHALDSWSGVLPGGQSMLAHDPTGKSVTIGGGFAYNANNYTMPAVGTLEILISAPSYIGDGSAFGNWNGNGIAWLFESSGMGVRFYDQSSFVGYTLVAADNTPVMHWVTTWDGSTQKFYINGILRGSQSVGSPSAGGFVGIGVYSNSNKIVSGRYQWLTIYKRPLSPGEVAAHAALVVQPS